MSRVADIPSDNAILCESCGYELTGVDAQGLCPECGKPIADSSPSNRHPPSWEDRRYSPVVGWLRTAFAALNTTRFFRGINLPDSTAAPLAKTFRRSSWFRRIAHLLAAMILGLASWFHISKFGLFAGYIQVGERSPLVLIGSISIIYVMLAVGTSLTISLTSFEARYRGLRLPKDVVARALDYQSVHLIPPAIVGVSVTWVYSILESHNPMLSESAVMAYLYTVGGGVIASAAYLFVTYWSAMKNLMYANRPVPEAKQSTQA